MQKDISISSAKIELMLYFSDIFHVVKNLIDKSRHSQTNVLQPRLII